MKALNSTYYINTDSPGNFIGGIGYPNSCTLVRSSKPES